MDPRNRPSHGPGAAPGAGEGAVRLQRYLSHWLLLYAMSAITVGLAVGYPLRGWAEAHSGGIGTMTTAAVFLVIYPMMVNLRVEALVQAGRNVRGLLLALVYNFVWAPLIGFVLVRLFLHDPLLALGFLLVMVVPCSSMSIAYTGLAKGDVELSTVIVGSSFVFSVVAVPAWMVIFAAGYHVPIPLGAMLGSILTVLIAPMLAGWVTRKALLRSLGAGGPARLAPVFSSASMLAMFAIIFLIFFAKAQMIVDRWPTVLLLLVPNALFMALTLAGATWLNRRMGLTYAEHMAVVFASAGKNNATAIAIAATAFTPLVAVPAATMPIFQVLLMVGYLKIAPRVRHYYTHRPQHPCPDGDGPVVTERAAAPGPPPEHAFEHAGDIARTGQRRALGWALGVNSALLVVEIAGGIVFGSLALLADATHLVSDVAGLGVALGALVLTARPVSARHSFGFARAEVMAAQVSALLLLAAGGWILYQGLTRLSDAVPVQGAGLAFVAALGLLVNAGSAMVIHRALGQSLNMRASFVHLATDAAGSLGALGAGVAILAWGWASADTLVSMGTAVLVLWTGWGLLRESTHVLMEGAPRALVTYQVLAAIAGVDGVVDAHHLHLWSLASDVSAASAHVVLSGHPTLRQAQQTGAQVKAALAERFDLTNVTLELEESPTVVVPNPSPARS